MPNIVMVVLAGTQPVRAAFREMDNGQWRGKGVDDPSIEVTAATLNEAIDGFQRRASYAVDAA